MTSSPAPANQPAPRADDVAVPRHIAKCYDCGKPNPPEAVDLLMKLMVHDQPLTRAEADHLEEVIKVDHLNCFQ